MIYYLPLYPLKGILRHLTYDYFIILPVPYTPREVSEKSMGLIKKSPAILHYGKTTGDYKFA